MRFHVSSLVRSAFAAGMVFLTTSAAAIEDPAQGLVRTLIANGVTDVSVAPNVWLYVPQGQPATPFVPPGPFTAQWQGWVSADLRSDFTFQAAFSGQVKVTINGGVALEAKGIEKQPVAGKSVRLNKGTNALLVEYVAPAMGDAFLRLYWTNRETPLSPLPLAQLSHATSEALTRSLQIHRGRDLVAELRCTKCHAAPGTMPELAMDAPTFNGIGARRQADWMARWIADPAALRPGTPMPKMFTGPEAPAEASAVAAYLATLKGESKFEPTTGDSAAGKALFEKLHCVACHVSPEGGDVKPHQISQKQVKAKFTPGALAAFLKKPEEHFAWIRMPNFKLSSEEAANLAAYLDSVADPIESKPPSADTAVIERGKNLVATSGCLNCHTLDGAKSELTAKPLAELASWTAGCLSDSPKPGSKSPHYALTAADRVDLRAFGATDRTSLGRTTEADFLTRQSRHLNCRECHGQFEGFPAWELLYGKLKPDWAERFIAGQHPVKPRPWNEARMPAFPAYAKGLGEGLATIAGLSPVVEEDAPPANAAELAEAGRKLASANGGFSCISCHSAAEFGATQVFEAPGINFAQSFARLQPEYFRRWLRAPTMIDPTSKMPVYFDEEGKSPLPEVLGGDGPKTIQAVWEYLRLGDRMPRPE
ncbi:MAG TPA: c-type cytochrome [Verrucomicrobiota bacterium]|nr:hypothetical protein [Verrucomicrobiales bacterium]HRI14645.1 c-type cytochrome [Verrucomicrobiota bacterium]